MMIIQRGIQAMASLCAAAFVALFAAAPAAAQALNPNFEYGIDRRGGDYRSFDLGYDAPGLCAGQCAQEGQCRAWTYVKPGIQGPKARCWLKNVVPQPTRDGNVISGLRGNVVAQPPPPAITQPVTPPIRAASYVGCFKDTSVFDLNGFLQRSAQNTPQSCVANCRARGFAYAGVQYGESCLCGNSVGRYGAANTCNYACTGDRGQVCGGYNANSVYTTGLSAPSPPIAPPGPPAQPRPPAGDCWADSPTFVEQLEGAGNWRAVYTRRGGSNVFDAIYTRGTETGPDVLTLDRTGNTVRVKRNGYSSVLGSTIGADGVAHGMYDGGTRFTLTCGGR
jgi:hypothetical protein